ncbi:MAG TPA: lytic transglycosylase domain-containing protein [Vicinamibacteria bacterium]|jgi:hypothetical protein
MQPPSGERRNVDRRRTASIYPAARERRKGDRRKRLLAGAGLLATLAAGGGVLARARQAAHEEQVDVTTDDFRVAPPEGGDDPGDYEDEEAALDAIIQEAALLNGISAELIRAVIQTESQFDPDAVSPVGAQGLMQLMPRTASWLGVKDPTDPRENVLAGTKYLSQLLDRFNGNVALALAGYNAGPTVVARHKGIPPYGETRGYVRKIHQLVKDTTSAFHLPKPAPPPRRARLKSGRHARVTRTLTSARRSSRRTKATAARSARLSGSRSARSRPALRAKARTASKKPAVKAKARAQSARTKATVRRASRRR